jgi:PIN domain nuclease of toxin-antitoxin system
VIVLDASAILAVILKEPGADKVEATFGNAVISAATLAEILTKTHQRGLDSEGSYRRIVSFGIDIVPVTSRHARIAGEISRAPRELDLSLGDRLCIALAISLNCELLTSDRGMAEFKAGIPVTRFR